MTDKNHAQAPIAIVGMACRLPGAGDREDFWRLVRSGGSAVVRLPDEILDRELYFDPRKSVIGKSYTEMGALIPNREYCPAKDFLDPEVVACTDEAHLNLCGVAADALRHAGMDPFQPNCRNAGVYVGHAGGSNLAGNIVYASLIEETAQYLYNIQSLQQLGRERITEVVREVIEDIRTRHPQRINSKGPELAANAAAALISRAFGLNGPFMAVDAACASSLKGMLIGIRGLQQGRIDMALVGGASYCKSDSLVLFSQAQSVSPTGSRPFDADADGLISAEGYIVIVLKTLEKALADGDPIHAVIRSIGQSSDGKGKSLWAPRKEGQAVAIERAYPAHIDPNRLQFIEAHATSTQVGDATELTALAEFLQPRLRPGKRIPLGSVKANVGHTLETAGMAGLVKVVLAMKNQVIPPAINVRNLNPKIEWDKVPFYVPMQEEAWPEPSDGLPRRAAVNAFGIGGLNIHVVLDEFVPTQPLSAYFSTDPVPGVAEPPPNSPASAVSVSADEPIAVIGMGTILPGAHTVDAFWDLIVSGRDAKSDATPDRWNTELCYEPGTTANFRSPAKRGGYIVGYEYDWRKHKIPPKQLQTSNPLQYMLLDAAEQAIQHAGYRSRPFDRTKMGVVVGTIFGGDFTDQLQMGLRLPDIEKVLRRILTAKGVPADQLPAIIDEYRKVMLEHMPSLLDETGSFTSSTLASRLTKTFDLMGGAMAVDAGPGSGLAALSACVDILRSGACDMMICASGQRNMDLITFEGLSLTGRLAIDDCRSPFAAGSKGVLPGEGVAVVLLKRLSDARRDRDTVHTVIRGVGAGANMTDHADATRRAMQRAIENARVQPQEVLAVDTSTMGLEKDNYGEVETISEVYGSTPRPQPLVVTTLIDQIGHTGGATGIVSLVRASLSLENRMLAAGRGVLQPSELVTRHGHVMRTLAASEALPAEVADAAIMGVTAGSGSGLTFHAILDRGVRRAEVAPSNGASAPVAAKGTQAASVVLPSLAALPWRILRIGALSMVELEAKLQEAQQNPAAFFEQTQTRFTPADRARLAIVAGDIDELAKKLTLVCEQFHKVESRTFLEGQGVFLRTVGAVRPRIAFMFPGQNSQYVGMLRELTSEHPAAAVALHEINAALAEAGYFPFGEYAWVDRGLLGVDNWTTQISILMASNIMAKALVNIGIKPDVVAGHSFGENPALTAAGGWKLLQSIHTVHSRSSILDKHNVRGAMMATTAPQELTEAAVREIGGAVYVANFNAPKQTVVAGEKDRVQMVIDWLNARKQKSRMLVIPSPYHTPIMEPIKADFREVLAKVELLPLQVRMLSSVTNEYVAGPEEVRENLVNQLTAPVNYVAMVRRLASEQPTVFVEVGPQQTLSTLHPRILEDADAMFIASDNPRRPGAGQLFNVQAMLEVCGALESPGADREEIVSASPIASPSVVAAPSAVVAPAALAVASAQVLNSTTSAARRSTADQPTSGTQEPTRMTTGKNGRVVHFDATLRRKEKMQQEAAGAPSAAPAKAPVASSIATKAAPASSMAAAVASNTDAPSAVNPTSTVTAAPAAAPVVASVAASTQAEVSDPGASTSTTGSLPPLDTAALQEFLIKFVCDETGYPPEIVELDADMEGDLGIDSIKKAQLFGELGEHFPITPSADMSMDDFTTLRHVMEFIQKSLGANAEATPKVTQALQTPPSTMATAAGPMVSAPSAPPAPAGNAEATSQAASAASVAASVVTTSSGTTSPSGASLIEDLDTFLVKFVCDETGYPPEIVELDADLEGDLGIDSIKKAQLFGELGEHFPITPSADMSLDDFTTLRHVKNYIEEQLGSNPLPKARHTEQSRTAPAAQAPSPATDANSTAADSPQAVVMPSVAHANNSSVASEPTTASGTDSVTEPPAVSANAPAGVNLEALANLDEFLINFVVQETGYPPEIVELDADLEGDLGIDSIKKAQLFGELGEHFPIRPSADMSLDDFTTLRHVKNFIVEQLGASGDGSRASGTPEQGSPPVVHTTNGQNGHNGHAHSAAHVADPHRNGTSTNGSSGHHAAYERGVDFGRANKEEIYRSLRWLADSAGQRPDLDLTPRRLAFPTPEQMEEMRGIADGAGVPVENVIAHQALLQDDVLQARLAGAASRTSQLRQESSTFASPARGSGRNAILSPTTTHSDVTPPAANAPIAGPPRQQPNLDLVPREHRTMRRHVMRMVAAPLVGLAGPLQLQGPVVIVGAGSAAEALQAELSPTGLPIYRLSDTDPNAAIAELVSLWQASPAPHLFLMNAAAAPSAESIWTSGNSTAVLHTFLIVQKWIELIEQSNLVKLASLAALVEMGGDFSFASGSPNLLAGGITGLLKALRRECEGLLVKVLDVEPGAASVTAVRMLLAELASGAPECEVALRRGERCLVQAAAEPAPAGDASYLRGGVWVVTGGARGVTALVARELARRFGWKLHLLGSSPLREVDPAWRNLTEEQFEALKPAIMKEAREAGEVPAEAWKRAQKTIEIDRNLRQLAAAGITATYHVCDVTNRAALAQTLDNIRQADGPISGVIHGAGVEIPCRMAKKKFENVQATVAPKVDGTLALMSLTRNDPLRAFIAFGSNSGRFGGHGQADYSLASEMQAKIVSWYRGVRPDVNACCFLWPSWDEVGMAVRPEIKGGLKRVGLSFLPPAEGISHLIEELVAATPVAEVLVLDKPHLLDLDGTMTRAGQSSNVAEYAVANVRSASELSSNAPNNGADASQYPLIESFEPGATADSFVAKVQFDPDRDLFLSQHRFNGKPFLPAVISVELFAEAAQLASGGRLVVGMKDVQLVNGFSMQPGRPQTAEIRVELNGNVARCRLVAGRYDTAGRLAETERVYASASVELGEQPPNLVHPAPGEPAVGYAEFIYPPEQFIMYHGELLRGLKSTAYQRDGGRSTLLAPSPLALAGHRHGNRWLTPSVLLDGCFVSCGTYTFVMLDQRVELPHHMDQVRFARLPQQGESLVLRLFYKGEGEQGAIYDGALFGADGNVVLDFTGFGLARLEANA